MKPSDNSLTGHLEHFGVAVTEQEISSVFQRLSQAGAEWTEFFFEHTESTRVMIEDQKIDRILEGTDRGLGIRVISDRRTWTGYTTDLSFAAIEKLADSISGALSGVPAPAQASRPWRTPDSVSKEMTDYKIQRPARELPVVQKIEYAMRADRAARKELSAASTRQVTAVWLDSIRKTLVLNSDHLMASHTKTYLQMMVQVVGVAGGESADAPARVESALESDGGYVGLEFFDKRSPETLGKEAAQRVQVLLRSKPAPAGSMPVVLSADAGGTMIHEAVGHGLEADLACNGLSVYEGKIGQTVASPLITVVDDGTMVEKRGSYAVDDEGTPSHKNVLIEKGVLKGYMVDRLSAMKFDLSATGNGRRESFRHKPIVRMTNTYVAPGKDNPEQILKDTKWGIFVKSMGGGQVNTVTGDFVFAVTEGYLIRDGVLGEAIRGATLVGNGPKVISIVDRVGSDLGFSTGTCGKDGQGAPVTDAQPTMRIPELIVGGEVPASEYWTA